MNWAATIAREKRKVLEKLNYYGELALGKFWNNL